MNRYPETLFPPGQHPARQPKRCKGRFPANVVQFPAGGGRAPAAGISQEVARDNRRYLMEQTTLANLQEANAALGVSKKDGAVLEAFQITMRMNLATLRTWIAVGQALAAQGARA